MLNDPAANGTGGSQPMSEIERLRAENSSLLKLLTDLRAADTPVLSGDPALKDGLAWPTLQPLIAEYRTIGESLSRLSDEQRDLAGRADRLRDALSQPSPAAPSGADDLAALQTRLARAQDNKERQRSTLRQLQDESDRLRAKVAQLEREQEDLERTIARQKKSRGEVADTLFNYEKDLLTQPTEVTKAPLRAKIEEAQGVKLKLEQSLTESELKLEATNQEIDRLRGELRTLGERQQAVSRRIKNDTKLEAQLTKQVEQLNHDEALYASQLTQLRDELPQVEGRLALVRNDHATASGQLAEKRSALITAVEAQISRNELRIVQLNPGSATTSFTPAPASALSTLTYLGSALGTVIVAAAILLDLQLLTGLTGLLLLLATLFGLSTLIAATFDQTAIIPGLGLAQAAGAAIAFAQLLGDIDGTSARWLCAAGLVVLAVGGLMAGSRWLAKP